MDFLVGRLVSAIDKAGLKDNTLVIFCTDNGSVKPGFLNGKPYAKGKGRTADYGAYVPFIARAPFLRQSPDYAMIWSTSVIYTLYFLELCQDPTRQVLKARWYLHGSQSERKR